MKAPLLKSVFGTLFALVLFSYPSSILSAPVKILRIGDSITSGYTHGHWFKDEMAKAGIEWEAQGTRPSWYWEDDYNWNEGWGGCTIQWFKNYQTTYTIHGKTETLNYVPIVRILKQYKPDIILLMLGTNNMGGDSRFLGGYDSLYIEYHALLDSIDRLGPSTMHVIIATIPFAKAEYTDRNERVKKFNELVVRRLVKERAAAGKKYSLVEAESAINNATDLQDAVHPNELGIVHFAKMWIAGIQKVLNGTVANIPMSTNNVMKMRSSAYKLMLPFSNNFVKNNQFTDLLGRTGIVTNANYSNQVMVRPPVLEK